MSTNEQAVNEHIRALLARDINALVEGYTQNALIILGSTCIVGKDAIRAMFTSVPQSDLPTEVSIQSMTTHGEYTLVTYEHDNVRGGDTFHIRDGKIRMQSVVLVPAG